MAVTRYTFNKLCDPGKLTKEIEDSAITIAFDHIETLASPETTDIYFKAQLPAEDETLLGTIVTNHVNAPLPDEARSVSLSSPKDAGGFPIFARKPVLPVYSFHNLVKTGGSRDMNVDGSGTPVNFEFVPGSGEVWEIERLLFGLDDVGLTDFGLFGGVSALPNGLLITVRTGGVAYTIGTIKDNVDVAMMFPGMIAAASGILDSSDGIYGGLNFQEQTKLDNATGDYIRIAVRDNLRAINILRSMVVARRIL